MKNTIILLALAVLTAIAPWNAQAQNAPERGLAITMPAESEFLQGDAITFAGVVSSDASQYAQSMPAYSYSWTSSIDGPIGTGVAVSTSTLSAGAHTITLTAMDELGRTLTAEKKITITAQNLTARIYSSESEGFFSDVEQAVLKAVSAGGIPPYSYAWTVDKAAGGNGQTVSKTFPAGNHKIELTVRDSGGSSASASMYLTVYAATPALKKNLTASIAEPANYQSFIVGSRIRFSAEASGGTQPYYFLWTGESGNVLSREQEFLTGNLSSGGHKTTGIHLTVTDAGGVSASSSVTISLQESCIIDGICSPGEDYLNCPRDCAGKKDAYCDSAPDGICDPDCARSIDPDCACNNDRICEAPYENAQNCPADCAIANTSNAQGTDQGTEYFMLAVLVLLTIAAAAYLRFIRRR